MSLPPKKKVCKGKREAKDFESCGEFRYLKKYNLCSTCLYEFLYFTGQGKELLHNKILTKAKKDTEKKSRKKSNEEKDVLVEYDKKLQEKVNAIVRLIDIGLPCLAKNYHPNQMHAGHIYSRGSEKSMRYNLHNIHRQSAQSNHFQNEDGLLREGLIKEYGTSYFEFIGALRSSPTLKLAHHEFKALYKKSCSIFNLLKKEGRIFNLEQRLEMRNQVNLELGIYEEEFCVFKN